MANPYYGETAQANKTGSSGYKTKRGPGAPGGGGLTQKVRSYPAPPGKSGPNRNTTGVPKLKVHAQEKGL